MMSESINSLGKHKATENKDLNFNILIDYPTKIRDIDANLKDNDKYNKKWTVISNMFNSFTKTN